MKPLERLAVVFLILSIELSCSNPLQPVDPPNIVLIMTDDQGYGDVGFTGNHRIHTPHIDRLAREGTVFESFYVSPVCAPTRASLLTGRYHQRTGVRGVIEGREFMVQDEVTVAEILQGNGYRTGLFGKWHLGENYPWVPFAQGFDEFVGFRDGSSHYFDQMLENNGRSYPTQGYLTDILTDEAIHFIEENKDRPFFLYLPFNAPHTPLEVPERYLEAYRDLPEFTRYIYAMLTSVDENIGRLLNRLEQLKLEDKTIVFFLSDNGPLFGSGRFEKHERYNAGLRGTKYQVFEGGVRVPLIVKTLDSTFSGQKISIPAAHIDILPTILDFCGTELPADLQVDGRSLVPLVSGKTNSWTQRTLFMHYPGERNLREKEPDLFPGGMAIQGRFKMVDGDQLYDVVEDPGETRNLADYKSEKLAELNSQFRSFWSSIQQGRKSYPRVEVGWLQENPARLTAHWARLSGEVMWQFEEDPPKHRSIGVHDDWISNWEKSAKATWRLDFQAEAEYRIGVLTKCSPNNSEISLLMELSELSLRQVFRCDETWNKVDLGLLEVPPGPVDLILSVPDSTSKIDLDISEIVIERIGR